MNYTIKNNIQQLLDKKGKSAYWLSQRAGISLPTVYSLTKNNTESIKFDIMANIAIALECSFDDMFTLVEK